MSLPSGTLTFMFTDIEGSTRLWDRDEASMRVALAEHNRILQDSVARNDGEVFKTMGDSVCAVFVRAEQAVLAAFEAQRDLQALEPGDESASIRVRMALYTGFAQAADHDYAGPPLNRVSRILSVAHGGQILVSEATRDLAVGSLPKSILLRDLGTHNLRDLERSERIYQIQHAQLMSTFPPLKSLAAFRHNLPIQLTGLIGRENEIKSVVALVEAHRLITLYGSGGCGKTRLALQVGAEVVDRFKDGVWLVELGNAADSNQMELAVSAALGLREEGGRDMRQVISQFLREKSALFILDNCEHLVEACATLAHELLRACPDIKLLVTSREILSVSGEMTWRVPSLSVPPGIESDSVVSPEQILQSESARLFIERASEISPGFQASAKNAAAIGLIVNRLDGIPLAIELAAARVKLLSVDQIAARLKEHFSILVGPRTALPRHKTIQATMDWSYLLLEEPERVLLDRLSTFVNGWTLESAEQVCAISSTEGDPAITRSEVLDLLSRLEDKSLISVDARSEQPRYHMLQMVREYTSVHLSDSERVILSLQNLSYSSRFAIQAEEQLAGPGQLEWLARLDTEYDNLRSALEFAKGRLDRLEEGLLLAGALARYWQIRGYLSEGKSHLWAIIAMADPEQASEGYALALNGLASLIWIQGDIESARSHYSRSLKVWRELGNARRTAGVLSNLGLVSIDVRNYDEARALLHESLALRRQIGDLDGEALSLMNLGIVARYEKNFELARDLYTRCLEIFRRVGNQDGEGMALNNLGDIIHESGDLEGAMTIHESCLRLFERIGDKRGGAYTLLNLGESAIELNRPAVAAQRYSASLTAAVNLGSQDLIIRLLHEIARLALMNDQAAESACLLGAAAARRAAMADASRLEGEMQMVQLEQAVRATLGDEAYMGQFNRGSAMSNESAVLFAQEICDRQIDSTSTT